MGEAITCNRSGKQRSHRLGCGPATTHHRRDYLPRMAFSVRVAKGVRIGVSRNGVRTSVGRGGFRYSTTLGPSPLAKQRQLAQAAKLDEAARQAGGFYTSGFGLQPPAIGGEGLDRIDVVLTAEGLRSFDEEHAGAREYDVDGLRVRVLPLERVIARKRAAKRPKDAAQLLLLEAALAARRQSNEKA